MRKSSLLLLGALLGTGASTLVLQMPFPMSEPAHAASAGDTYRQLSVLGDVLEHIRNDYVEKPDDAKLVEAAINGMLSSLDPHSSYMDAKSFRDMQIDTKGEFAGVGIQITVEEGSVKVIEPTADSPATRAGILSGDIITRIDGEPVKGLSLDQVAEKVRGPVKSSVKLTIVRKDRKDPLELKLTREIIQVKSVKFHQEDDVGYIQITQFSEQTTDDLRAAIDSLKKGIGDDRLKGYVLDLRNDPGLVLLINGGSASASEIVAGALQDHKRATLLGTRSFGKGSVQTIIPVGNDAAIRLTTARYFTPSGHPADRRACSPARQGDHRPAEIGKSGVRVRVRVRVSG
jgi:carboxyl-terminal processing protease